MKPFFFGTEGRIARARFWLGQLAIAGVLLGALIVMAILVGVPHAIDGGKSGAATIVGTILALVVFFVSVALAFWGSLCLGIKRYHDHGKPGVWVLIQFAPIIGGLWYFIEAFCLPGTYGANAYGPDPLHPGVGLVTAPTAGRSVTSGRPDWVVPLLLAPAVLGLVVVLVGVGIAIRTQSWLAAAEKVEGKVVALDSGGRSSDGVHETYRAVVAAQTKEGAPLRITGFWATYPAPEIGSAAELAYPAGEPNQAIIVDFPNQWVLPIILGALGGVGILFWLFVALLVKLFWKRELAAPGEPARQLR